MKGKPRMFRGFSFIFHLSQGKHDTMSFKAKTGVFNGHRTISIFPADRADEAQGDRPIITIGARKARALLACSEELAEFVQLADAAEAPEPRKPRRDTQEDISERDAEPRKARKSKARKS